MTPHPNPYPTPATRSPNQHPRTKQEPVPEDTEPRPAIEILRQIKSKELDAKSLTPDDRRVCVQHLLGEGLSNAEMAHLLGCHDRTIERGVPAHRD